MKQPTNHTYSDAIYNTRVAILGITPPPLGGVSVHTKRVMHKLRSQNNTVLFFNTERRGRYRLLIWYLITLGLWLVRHRPTIIMYHSLYLYNSYADLFLITVFAQLRNTTCILIEHDCRHMYQRSGLKKRILQYAIRSCKQLALIGSKTYQSYVDNNIAMPQKTTIESAFLPPDKQQQHTIIATYPQKLWHFVKNHSPCLLVNACQLILLEGNDLYGIESCLIVLRHLIKTYPSAGLIVALAQTGNYRYYNQLLNLIKQNNLHNHIYMLEGQKELWPLFQHIDLFVRPTLSDGASVSIEEALYFDVPVVASDICWRPAPVNIFKTADVADFTNKVEIVLKKRSYETANQ